MTVLQTAGLRKIYGAGDTEVRALDGIGLTVAAGGDTSFSVSLIPHARGETTLADKTVGETVNLENDVLAKYVEKLLRPRADEDAPAPRSGGLTLDFLRANGF